MSRGIKLVALGIAIFFGGRFIQYDLPYTLAVAMDYIIPLGLFLAAYGLYVAVFRRQTDGVLNFGNESHTAMQDTDKRQMGLSERGRRLVFYGWGVMVFTFIVSFMLTTIAFQESRRAGENDWILYLSFLMFAVGVLLIVRGNLMQKAARSKAIDKHLQ